MKSIPWIIIAGLLVVIFFLRECSPKPSTPAAPIVITHVDTIPGDPIPYEVKRAVPYPVPGETQYIPVPVNVDTAVILRDYFARRPYLDSIKVDSSFLAIIQDTISENKIKTRRFFLQNLRKKAIVTTQIIEPQPAPILKNKLFVGSAISYDLSTPGVGGSVMLISKKDNGYTYSYDFLTHRHTVGVYWKLHF